MLSGVDRRGDRTWLPALSRGIRQAHTQSMCQRQSPAMSVQPDIATRWGCSTAACLHTPCNMLCLNAFIVLVRFVLGAVAQLATPTLSRVPSSSMGTPLMPMTGLLPAVGSSIGAGGAGGNSGDDWRVQETAADTAARAAFR
jgi:hypothetical protein